MKPLVECLLGKFRAFDVAATDTVESIRAQVRSTRLAAVCQELSELANDFGLGAALAQFESLADTLRAGQVAEM